MTRRPANRARLAVLVLAACTAVSVTAHQLRIALTTVEPNPRTERVEVIHRFYVHDAEHATGLIGAITGNLRDSEAARIRFAGYVAERFVLADADGTPLPLELLGAEIDGDHLWVYQEMPLAAFDEVRAVSHDSLQDVWTNQVNQVNVRRGDAVRTLYLRTHEGLQAFEPLPGVAEAPADQARDER